MSWYGKSDWDGTLPGIGLIKKIIQFSTEMTYKFGHVSCHAMYVHGLPVGLPSFLQRHVLVAYYTDVIWASCCLKSPVFPPFIQTFVHGYIKENSKALCYWPVVRGTTGHRCFPLTKTTFSCHDFIMASRLDYKWASVRYTGLPNALL